MKRTQKRDQLWMDQQLLKMWHYYISISIMYTYYILYNLYYSLCISYIKHHLLNITLFWKPSLHAASCLFQRQTLQMLQVQWRFSAVTHSPALLTEAMGDPYSSLYVLTFPNYHSPPRRALGLALTGSHHSCASIPSQGFWVHSVPQWGHLKSSMSQPALHAGCVLLVKVIDPSDYLWSGENHACPYYCITGLLYNVKC